MQSGVPEYEIQGLGTKDCGYFEAEDIAAYVYAIARNMRVMTAAMGKKKLILRQTPL